MMPASTPIDMHTTSSSLSEWEAAYQRFETPRQEVAKFKRRLRLMGAESWPRDAQVVEIFCGRGNGLIALDQLGFKKLEGVDLSADLLSKFEGDATTYVRDCRNLHFDDNSRDIIIVQGGLHHLPTLPDDLAQTLDEVKRVLRPGGRLMAIEPWRTPFLRAVHFASERPLIRTVSKKLDALHTMIIHEQETYDQWLGQPNAILKLLDERFERERLQTAWGKLLYLGRKK
jgi:ubiquinone/menaquinone biosynthesis C-methylase UbiE